MQLSGSGRQKIRLYGFVAVTLLAATFRMLILPKYNFDEYFTINLVRNSWGDVVRLTALDVHPPLYYLVTKLMVTVFGENFFGWHVTSFVCFLLMLFATERFVSARFGDGAAAMAVLALCSAPNMLRYCLQARMYSMAMLLITLAFYLVARLGEQYEQYLKWKQARDQGYVSKLENLKKEIRHSWICLALANTAAAYTHYFAGVAAVGLSLFLLGYLCYKSRQKEELRKLLLHWLCYCGAMAVLYLPWLFVMFRQMRDINGNYWIARPDMDTLYGYLDMLFAMDNEWLQAGLVIVFFLGCFFLFTGFGQGNKAGENPDGFAPESGREGGNGHSWLYGSFFAAGFVLLFGLGYSVLRTPILIDRYLVIVIPMLWVTVIPVLFKRLPKWMGALLLILFCLCFIRNQESLYREYDAVENSEETQCLLDNVKEGDILYHTNAQRLAERAAFLPDARHVLLEGCDDGEAFHYWTELTGCERAADEAEVMRLAMNAGAQIGADEAAGTEEIDVVNSDVTNSDAANSDAANSDAVNSDVLNSDVAIWCEDEDCLPAFVEAGWQVEEYPAWSVVFYRITR